MGDVVDLDEARVSRLLGDLRDLRAKVQGMTEAERQAWTSALEAEFGPFEGSVGTVCNVDAGRPVPSVAEILALMTERR